MKKYITPDQIRELNDKEQQLLKDWWKPEPGDMALLLGGIADHIAPLYESGEGYWNDLCESDFSLEDKVPLLSIGQMIEFLKPHLKMTIEHEVDMWFVDDYYNGRELCDALWDAVKKLLSSNPDTRRENYNYKIIVS
jgi:hypothetical protein